METSKNKAALMTSDGEFVYVKIKNNIPHIGDEYCGEAYNQPLFLKPAAAAACFIFLFFAANTAYSYYTPASSVLVEINPSIKLDINKWEKVIKAVPLNDDAKKLLKCISVKNDSIDEALTVITEEAKKENYIGNCKKNSIKISIKYNKNVKKINFSSFSKYADNNNINIILNNGTKNSDKENKLKNTENKESNYPLNNGKSNLNTTAVQNNNKESENKNKVNNPSKLQDSNTKDKDKGKINVNLPKSQGNNKNSSNRQDNNKKDKSKGSTVKSSSESQDNNEKKNK